MSNVVRLVPFADNDIEFILQSDARTWVMLGWLFGRGMVANDLPTDLKVNEARTIIRVVWQELKVREGQSD